MPGLTYRDKYSRFKKDVDASMGRPRGKWARLKTIFSPNSFSDARKEAIDAAETAHLRGRIMGGLESRAAKLYQMQNIIGSTRAPGQLPTVYYRSNSGTFGHITQEHGVPENIGREPARKHRGYSFANTGPDGALVEKIGEEVVHVSRNAFVPVATDDERKVLSQAQRDFPHIKERYFKMMKTALGMDS